MKQLQLLILMLFTTFAFAQERTVEGKVVDENGEPLIGATVRVPGTSLGALTGVDGVFSIADIPADATQLRLSYLGQDKTVDITDAYMDISLNTSQSIEVVEIVNLGYGTVQRERFTGASTAVGDKIIEDKSTGDISESLAGEVAGLNVYNANGQPGTTATIRIRGFGSVSGSQDPLYIVDGIEYNGDLSAINPADIENSTVLKDASATAIYGSRGANGVIIINTKKGRTGQSEISVDVKNGINYRGLPYYDVIQSPEEYVEIGWDGLRRSLGSAAAANAGLFDPAGEGLAPYYNLWDAPGDALIDPATGQFYPNVNRLYTPERRRDIFFDNANRTEANITLRGGEGRTTYATSLGFLDEEGYFLASQFRRLSGRLNVGHEIKPWLRGSMNMGYSDQESDTPGQSGASSVNGFFLERNAPPIYGIYERDASGNLIEDPIFGGPLYDFGDGNGINGGNTRRFSSLSNIAAVNTLDDNIREDNTLFGNIDFTATFLNNFEFVAKFGLQSISLTDISRANPYYGQSSGSNGSLSRRELNSRSYTTTQILRYSNELGENEEHVFTINAAHEAIAFDQTDQFASGTNLADPFAQHFDLVLDHNPNSSFSLGDGLESYFAFGDYSYKDKFLVNASIRRDGSSVFAPGNRWGTFGAVGVGYVLSEEEFIQNKEWIDFLKVRASWGLVGDRGIRNSSSYFRGGGNTFNVESLNGQPSFVFRQAIDPNLTWETSEQIDFGLEAALFGNRISASLDYYEREVADQFYFRQQPASTGISTFLTNDGTLANRGIEFDITGRVIDKEDFYVDLTINGESFTNEWVEPATDPATGEPIPVQRNGSFAFSQGSSIYDFYLPTFVGVDPATGFSQWEMYYDDINNNGTFDAGTDAVARDYIDYLARNENANLVRDVTSNYGDATFNFTGQSAIPDIRGATRLNVGYKNFSLTAQLLYSLGGYGRDGNYQALMRNDILGSNNFHEDMRNRWQQPGDVTDVPGLTNGQPIDGVVARWQNLSSTRFITSSDFLLLNNVRVNYALPASLFEKVGLAGAQIWVSGDNLWAQTERQGFMPFITPNGIPSREAYDPLSTFTTGVQLKF